MITELQIVTISSTMALLDDLDKIREEDGEQSEIFNQAYNKMRNTVDRFLKRISEKERNQVLDRYSEIKKTGKHDFSHLLPQN